MTALAAAAVAAAAGCGGGAEADACFEQGRELGGEALLYVEYNATDGDAGVHGAFGAEGLAEACVQRPDGTAILVADPVRPLDALGINQLFFESREPPVDEYSLADLKADFPEGGYRISGVDFEGERRVGTARFTHAFPAPPEIVSPAIAPEEAAEENTVAREGLTVRWRPVTETVDGGPVEIAAYEVIVTKVEHEDPDALSRPVFDVHVPPEVTELAVPAEFLEPGTVYELELLAIERSGNQTIALGFFATG